MPTLESYYATKPMEPQALPRASAWWLSQTGAGMEAEAKAKFGGALQSLSLDALQRMEETQTQSQYTDGKAAWGKGINDFLVGLEKDQDFEGYDKKYKTTVKSLKRQILKKGLTTRAKQGLTDFIKIQKVAFGKQVAAQYLRKQKDYARASTYNAVRVHELAGNVAAAEAALIEGRDAGYIGAEEAGEEVTKVKRNVEWYAGIHLANNNPELLLEVVDDPEYFESLNKVETERLKDEARSNLATLKRGRATAIKEKQDEVGRQMLIDLWTGDLTESAVREAVSPEAKWITTEQAKYLRKALLSKEPRETDLLKYAEVKDAVLDVGLGRKTRKQALNVLYKNITNLSDEHGKQSLDAIYAATLKDDNYWVSESRDYMEEQVREKDPLTGLFTDDASEIALAAQSKLLLDKTIEDAAAEGKPLSGRDILIKAHEIAIPLRQQAAELRKRKRIPEAIGEELGEVPFITEADLDRAEEQARKNLGVNATKREIKAEMLRLLGE